ncbi:putative Major facilitator superfamily protein [Hibiscus syriacus]|uniref:Major facilitator superfamily protein n=1 Tax=Hibiscus syriacus TaxID=106335 RepID=A0A6A2YN37_HIBSY|nr:putative Major facilitator superfamily protein [Hibiscus syriacus]
MTESISREHFQLQRSLKLLDDVASGAVGNELEARSLRDLQIIQADAGFLRCNFIVPAHASDINGNWHAGAIATIIDSVGATAIYSVCQHVKVTVNFNIQYHSTAKIQVNLLALLKSYFSSWVRLVINGNKDY